MAAFDYDWTLVSPKGGRTFPSNIEDWEWLYPSIPERIKQYYEEGFMIVIFTNQSKSWKHEQIQVVANMMDIPMFVVIATEKGDYKPNTIPFTCFMESFREIHKIHAHNVGVLNEKKCKTRNGVKGINKDKSFFVGDALGRSSDFSDSDKVFAENIGIPYYCPEQVFHTKQEITDIPTIPLPDDGLPTLVIMMGYPGSGKSTIAKQLCKQKGYVYIEGDVYKTSVKMIKASLQHISLRKSIVFDATHTSVAKRKEYVDLAKTHSYAVVCVHVATPLDIAYKRNKLRNYEKYVPKIAYSVYSKNHEPPSENEGFTLFVI